MKKRVLSMLLAAALSVGLAAPTMAHTTPDFTDVPRDHWAYEAIMEMADAGVIKGTGDGRFSPEENLTAEMFLVLIGRIIFPDVVADKDDWSGLYLSTASGRGLLDKTSFTDLGQLKGELTRYDMAEILAQAIRHTKVDIHYSFTKSVEDEREAAVEIGVWSSGAQTALKDFEIVPPVHKDAVCVVYAAELMMGDGDSNFNGDGTVTRMEAAVVLQRFLALQDRADLAIQLIAQRLQQELETAGEEYRKLSYLSKEELEKILFQMDENSFDLLSGGRGGNYKTEVQMIVLNSTGISEKTFDAAYKSASNRRRTLAEARDRLEGITTESMASIPAGYDGHDLAFQLRSQLSWLGGLEEDRLVALMDDLGVTSAELDEAYHLLDQKGQEATYSFTRACLFDAAGEFAFAAARMAKAEGKKSYTIRAHGWISTVDVVGPHFKPFPLNVYDGDGQLIGEVTAYSGIGWGMDITFDTKRLDETFTIKLEEPFESDWYRLLPEEADEATGGLKDLVSGVIFSLRGGKVIR